MFPNKVLIATIGVSALIHLSMVTLFSIYVWIPIERPHYYQMDIRIASNQSILGDPRAMLQMRTFEDRVNRGATAPNIVENAEALPEISLPSLDSQQLERSALIGNSLRIRSAFETQRKQDTWSLAIEEIGKLDDKLRALTPIASIFPEEKPPQKAAPFSRPVPGIAMTIEWMSEPRNRELLFAAPVDTMWQLENRRLRDPITVSFKANSLGEVVYVLPHTGGEDDDFAVSLSEALKKYRFAPLDDSKAGEQFGTLIVSSDEDS